MSKPVTPVEYFKAFYESLMSQGYKINEIDEMDFFYYFDILIYNEKHEDSEWDCPTAFVDQI